MRRHNFRKLRIWELGMDLVDMTYEFADTLPDDEKYGLRSQITRCSVSIPSNIAEGSAKRSTLDFLRFLDISLGSSYELETQLLICQRRGFGSEETLQQSLTATSAIQKSIAAFQTYLQNQKS